MALKLQVQLTASSEVGLHAKTPPIQLWVELDCKPAAQCTTLIQGGTTI